ncbi:MAG: DEAD/DEAH box helicase family protein [Peptoniphilus grossensis]|uniref:DEAD/DEAH box helicase family protein n=1 Tax=Peptoniphilus grossensis TaxID=1465756 RepID=UPI002911AC57|nr:DEAD/DEAH box helicase family protein [Peptoniphilus grossensis]MDU7150639.1 DEAD/DEAH box helicase family protein [Peptoniphilus grossensis]
MINVKTTREVIPQCYAYTTPCISYHEGWTKIGFTERDVETRIREQTQTAGIKYDLKWHKNALYEGSYETFTDKDFHGYLNKLGVKRQPNTEWFEIEPNLAKSYFNDFRENKGVLESNEDPIPYVLRREQDDAVEKTIEYFKNNLHGEFLWNAKPRFGKTISAYDLCMKMKSKNILIVTNRPAIANSWYEDYLKFVGANSGYYFVSHVAALDGKSHVITREEFLDLDIDKIRGSIEFVSLQDIKGSKYFGGDPSLDKLKELSNRRDEKGNRIGILWDILIIDEAHEGVDTYKTDIAFDNIDRNYTLHLSGTPFKALANDKFPQDAIYNWTYADEQRSKRDWDLASEEENPYYPLPKLNLFTYQMSEIVRDNIKEGIEIDGEWENYAFDLNEFFKTRENGKFYYEDDVDKFLDALTSMEKFPFSTPKLRKELKHTFWLMDRVDSAKAMGKKLRENPIFSDYEIVIAAGDGKLDDDEEFEKSYDKVVKAIRENDKTITLSVGQLTTGITIPEWTGVLMLSNVTSPSLYMQAAFRSQNPCLFVEDGKTLRKENAYVFDFDPIRTLDVFEKFANDLSSETSRGKGDSDRRKSQIRELLNFFPVYGEDDNGEMIPLDAEKVLITPRRIYAKEVVNCGFMSNFLFKNISNIFGAPEAVKNIIDKMDKGRDFKPVSIDENTASDLDLDENGEVNIPDEKIIGRSKEIFGKKIFDDVKETIEDVKFVPAKEGELTFKDEKKDIEVLKKAYAEPRNSILIDAVKADYGNEIKKSTVRSIENKLNDSTEKIIQKEYSNWKIEDNLINSEKDEKIKEAKSSAEVTKINEEYEKKIELNNEKMLDEIKKKMADADLLSGSTETITREVETEKKREEKKGKEDEIRDNLRGFARTIPSFLMAYGSSETNLMNFDKIIPDDVFKEVTSISLDEFRFLRDGGKYFNEASGKEEDFEGKLFDEIVFDDAVKEFLNKKRELANYFDENNKKDIFDYIPPQKTNQIFTPKKIVIEMVDYLEKENPGCFDDPDKTFIDLYMKSGLYITEIVKRLYRSERMKEIYPEASDRLNHIFAKQVYGLAPTEIIYRIATNYILGFNDDLKIEKHNLKKLDSLKYAKEGNLEKKLEEIFE